MQSINKTALPAIFPSPPAAASFSPSCSEEEEDEEGEEGEEDETGDGTSLPSRISLLPRLMMLSPLCHGYIPSGKPTKCMESVTRIRP